MPELPDLAVMAKNLSTKLVNHTVKGLTLHVDRKNNVPEKEMQEALVGHKVKSIQREGKELHFKIGDSVLGLHLMLHGELKVAEPGEEVKFPILQLDFPNQSLYLTDWQKSATPTLNPDEVSVPDALTITQDQFTELLGKKKSDIKTVLLDQKSIRGIGNAYADEILYDAAIAPHSLANKVPADKLYKSMVSVLNDAIENISKSDPDRVTGENRDFMKIHLPKTAQTKKGEYIIVDKKGSRKSYYVASQKEYK
ncbi:DNA-formamidopyrimidine glycosylase family protein [Pedobacter agri]|uniref:DNA-formamidopyrimidine glycosylase family protein n=1 Tax=Pedobacter agri TaxID=454586 RepID=UPI00277FB227|nr:DNA-formamidopyrimidine glycosylase family protein [Pedobacter agri]MDQ1139432.1 formamidopyrimidine-DNA glycosylase [Pedobacter agri]